MKSLLKISLLIFMFILICPPESFCNGNEPVSTSSIQADPQTGSDQMRRIKPDIDQSFFSLQVDRLNTQFFTRMGINFLSVFMLIRLIYFRAYKRKELFFTFFIFNFVIFLITHLLNKVDMGLGAAFGLFAVFSMLRYRTENIEAKDMTYLFLSITLGLITAIAKASALELCILNGLILLVTFLLEGGFLLKREMTKNIQYENIDLISPENQDKLLADLKARTGLDIHRVDIGKIDFLKDTASIKIYYSERVK
jgi:hypothetical protein